MIKKQKKRSQTTIGEIKNWIKNKIPFAMCILYMLLSFIPTQNNYFPNPIPLTLLPLFYWTINKPNSIGFFYTFILAFIYDIIENGYFGINLFLMLSIYFCFTYQKFIPLYRNFIISYYTFIAISLLYYLIKTSIFTMIFKTQITSGVITSFIIILLIYPINYWICEKINKRIFQ